MKIEGFETKRLLIERAKIEDCEDLAKIDQSWEEQEAVTGMKPADAPYFAKAIQEGALPPEGIKENHRLLVIRQKDNGRLVGVLDLYFGYPCEKTLWIGQLVMDQAVRGNGFGEEVLNQLAKSAPTFEKIGIGVHLKNWQALRFWHRNGFDRILRISGDNAYSSENFALMTLERCIKGGQHIMKLTPNLHFRGQCKEALKLYQKALGVEIKILLCNSDVNSQDEYETDIVYHAEFYIGGQRLTATDSPDDLPPTTHPMSLLITFETAVEVRKAYEILAEEAEVIYPLQRTSYSSCFVSLVDKFGMRWELMTEQTEK